jgi:hypothetical protein
MARYLVLGNVPFSEMEQPEFIDLLTYGRPQLRNRLVRADQMKVKVSGVIDDAERWLKDYISVRT